MELIIKLYNDKTSRIGVKYLQEYQAVKAYEEIISKYLNESFSIKLEPVKNKINLVLISSQTGGRVVYKDLDYSLAQLKRLESYTERQTALQFVHIYNKSNLLVIAKPFRTQKFLLLSDVEIINPVSFGSVI